jgi:peptidoglycan/LPS O-acetylase OafA/YrhL
MAVFVQRGRLDDAPRVASSSRQRFPELDLLRFIAALSVLAFHYTAMRNPGWGVDPYLLFPGLSKATRYGYLGVELFFMISGFVILMTALNRDTTHFLSARFVRLFPAYVVAVLLTTAVILLHPLEGKAVNLEQVLTNLSMLQDGLGQRRVDDAYWTLWIELRFYVLIAFLTVTKRSYRTLLVFMAGWLALAILFQKESVALVSLFVMPMWAPYFIFGMAMFMIRKFGHKIPLWGLALLSWALMMYRAPTLLEYSVRSDGSVSLVVVRGVVTAFCVILVLLVLGAFKGLSWRGWTLLGALTYPLYLTHQVIGYVLIDTLKPYMQPAVVLFLVTALMLFTAAAIVRWAERPLQVWVAGQLDKSISQIHNQSRGVRRSQASNVYQQRNVPDRSPETTRFPEDPVESVIEKDYVLKEGMRMDWLRAVVLGVATFIVTIVVAIPGLRVPPFRDEAVSASLAYRSVSETWKTILNTDAIHSAFNLLISALPIDYTNYFALRLVALVPVSLAGAILASWCVQRLGFWSGLFVGISWPLVPVTISVGSYARDYGLVMLFAVISSLLLCEIMGGSAKDAPRRLWVGYGIAIVFLGLFSVVALLLLVGHLVALVLLGRQRRKARFKEWALTTSLAAAVLSGQVFLVLSQPSSNFWVQKPTFDEVQLVVLRLFGGSPYGTDPPVIGATVSTFVVFMMISTATSFLVAQRIYGRLNGYRMAAFVVGLSWLFFPLISNFLVSFREPMFVARYLWYVGPAVLLVLACLIPNIRENVVSRSNRYRVTYSLAVVMLVAMMSGVVGLATNDSRRGLLTGGNTVDYSRVAKLLASEAQPDDGFVVDQGPDLYLRSGLFVAWQGVYPIKDVLVEQSPEAARDLMAKEYPRSQWPGLLKATPRIWVLSGAQKPIGPRERSLASGRDLVGEWQVRGLWVRLYSPV